MKSQKSKALKVELPIPSDVRLFSIQKPVEAKIVVRDRALSSREQCVAIARWLRLVADEVEKHNERENFDCTVFSYHDPDRA